MFNGSSLGGPDLAVLFLLRTDRTEIKCTGVLRRTPPSEMM